jgi:hypothetical protein
MTTLMETLLQQMDGDTVTQVAQQLGVNEQAARQGISLGVPTLVTALAEQASTEAGAANFAQTLQLSQSTGDLGTLLGSLLGGKPAPSAPQQAPASGGAGDLVSMLGSLLGSQTSSGGGQSAAPAGGGMLGGLLGSLLGGSQSSAAEAILTQMLGDKQPKVEDTLTKSTGIDGHALLKVLAPLVIAGVVKWMSSQKQGTATPADLAGALKNEQATMQTQNSDLMKVVTGMLDTNKDGSIVDDAMNILGKLMRK